MHGHHPGSLSHMYTVSYRDLIDPLHVRAECMHIYIFSPPLNKKLLAYTICHHGQQGDGLQLCMHALSYLRERVINCSIIYQAIYSM